MAEATGRALRVDASQVYGQIYALRPQGRDWLTYSAVRMRAAEGLGHTDLVGPFPNDILEIQIGTTRVRNGMIANTKKDMSASHHT